MPFALAAPGALAAAGPCDAPAPVCAARESVFALASEFDPGASAVLIAPGLLVTNRHVVADEEAVRLRGSDGASFAGRVRPSAYGGDLVLIEAAAAKGAPLPVAGAEAGPVYGIGADVEAAEAHVRVFRPGAIIARPPADKPLARLHHDAESRPGMSGGALVDARGRLIGIVTAGGQGRYNAIPAGAIAVLRDRSGPEAAAASQALGARYRACIEGTSALAPRPDPAALTAAVADCRATGNSQLIDAVAKRLGAERRYDEAIALFEQSLARDPNRPNTLLSLALTQAFAGRESSAAPVLARFLALVPNDRQALFLALRVGKASADDRLARRAVRLIERHHPDAAEAARRLLAR